MARRSVEHIFCSLQQLSSVKSLGNWPTRNQAFALKVPKRPHCRSVQKSAEYVQKCSPGYRGHTVTVWALRKKLVPLQTRFLDVYATTPELLCKVVFPRHWRCSTMASKPVYSINRATPAPSTLDFTAKSCIAALHQHRQRIARKHLPALGGYISGLT